MTIPYNNNNNNNNLWNNIVSNKKTLMHQTFGRLISLCRDKWMEEEHKFC